MSREYYKDRDGNLIPVPVSNNKILERMFSNVVTRALLKLASSRLYSNLQRIFLNSFLSTAMITDFVHKNNINLREYKKKRYLSFHDFFLREIKPEKRPLCVGEHILTCPCDAKASVYPITEESCFWIKDVPYTVGEVLGQDALTEAYIGGYFVLLRLCVEDYHHYCYPISGSKSADVHIPGKLYTVNPMIHRYAKVYRENARTYCTLQSNFGKKLVMMEVGALGVGRIVNDCPEETIVNAGEEKGHFEFGGSTVLLILPKDTYIPMQDLLRNTEEGYETIVKYGEVLGYES